MKTPRKKQREAIVKAVSKIQAGEKSITLILDPGYGKTLASQLICNELSRLGYIDGAMVYVPRTTLSGQYETDWGGDREDIAAGRFNLDFEWITNENRGALIGDFLEVPNVYPFVSTRNRAQFGAALSYAALCANPADHIKQFKSRRFAVIFDEAHQLGVAGEGGYGTKSAEIAEEIAQLAAFVIIMTGTDVRADGKFLLPSFARYEKRRSQYYLVPDVEARYEQAVEDNYLRRFSYSLTNVKAERIFADRVDEVDLSIWDGALKAVMEHPDTWRALVDEGMVRLKKSKETHPRFAALITAVDQEHAREIHKYINEKYPLVQALIAVSSDGEKAKKALRDFKSGYYDVLVTVKMAFVGYSYKWLLHWICCSHFRSFGDLKQTAGRVLRMLPSDVMPARSQIAHFTAPDDPRMRQFIRLMKEHMERGLKKYKKKKLFKEESEEEKREYYFIDNVEVKASGVLSLFGDEKPAHFDFHGSRAIAAPPAPTHKEKLKNARSSLQRLFTQTDLLIARKAKAKPKYGTTAAACKTQIGQGVNDKSIRTMDDIQVRFDWLNRFRAYQGLTKARRFFE